MIAKVLMERLLDQERAMCALARAITIGTFT
jgi:hypothetical protein